MAEQSGSSDKGSRQSSPRYPFINLNKALERAAELREAAGNNFALAIDARKIWGYGPKSSGGDQTIAALSYYGLIEDSGSGEGRKIKLTDAANRYFRDERPEVRQDLIAKFALNPKAMQALWQMWQHSPPADMIARSILKNDLGYSDWAATELLTIYRDNLQFVPGTTSEKSPEEEGRISSSSGKDGKIEQDGSTGDVRVGAFIQWSPSGIDQFKEPRPVDWMSPDGSYLRVVGSPTGIPTSEVTVVNVTNPKVADVTGADPAKKTDPGNKPDISVFLSGNRLHISADVDEAGLAKLKEMISKYEEILKILK